MNKTCCGPPLFSTKIVAKKIEDELTLSSAESCDTSQPAALCEINQTKLTNSVLGLQFSVLSCINRYTKKIILM